MLGARDALRALVSEAYAAVRDNHRAKYVLVERCVAALRRVADEDPTSPIPLALATVESAMTMPLARRRGEVRAALKSCCRLLDGGPP